jgi:excisionase family DNA binding protein
MQIPIMPKISINEAAKLLGVSSDTLRRWEESGKIEPERDGCAVIVVMM